MAEPILDFFALFGPVPPRGTEPGVAQLRTAMEKHNVMGAVTLSTRSIYYSAAAGNRETLAECEEAGAFLQPMALYDPRQPGSETMVQGAKAICLMPRTQGWQPGYAAMKAGMERLKNLRLPLYCEATQLGDVTTMTQMAHDVGWLTPIVFGGVSGAGLTEVVAAVPTFPKALVATNGLTGMGEVALAVQLLTAERVVFASGAVAHAPLSAMLNLVQAAELTPADKTRILNTNTKLILAGVGG